MTKRILSEEQKEKARQRSRAWYAKNRERALEKSLEWRSENPEKHRQKAMNYYMANKDACIEVRKAYYAKNKEKMSAWHKQYEAENKDKRKAWRIANRELKRLLENNRRLKIVGVLSKGIVKTLMEKQKGLCNGCQVDLMVARYHVDHIVAVSKGGKNIDSNVQLLCVSCNTSKGAKDFSEWKQGVAR
jgi:5-methylcytosine-specific restriction endonuclease McrA